MSTTRIRADAHGLFVKVDGGIYRPTHSPTSYKAPLAVHSSQFADRDRVEVINLKRTPFCSVDRGDRTEWWSFHGEYRGTTTEECWNPVR